MTTVQSNTKYSNAMATTSRTDQDDSPTEFSYNTSGSLSPAHTHTSPGPSGRVSPATNVGVSSPDSSYDVKPCIQDISPVIDRKPIVKNLLPSTSPLATMLPSTSPLATMSSLSQIPPSISISSPSDMTSDSLQGQGLLAIKQSPATSPGCVATASMAAGNLFANQMAAAAALAAAQQQGLSGLPGAESVAMGMNPLAGPTNMIAKALSIGSAQRRARSEKKSIPEDLKDGKYFERRKRNNMAAKKSRDARKYREDEIAIRASYLEKENAILRAQVTTLREEANSLTQLMLQKRSRNGN